MLHINRVTLLGHAGRDPEVRNLRSGDRTATFSLATTERWTDREGNPGERTAWHRVVVFGHAVKAAEAMVRKGATVMVEGRLTVRAYTDKQNNPRQGTEVVVAGPQGMVNVLSRKPDGNPARADADPALDVEEGEGDGGE